MAILIIGFSPPNAATDWLQRLEGVWQDPSYGDEDEKLNTLEVFSVKSALSYQAELHFTLRWHHDLCFQDAYIDLREPDGAAGARALHLTLEARPRTAALEEEAGNFEVCVNFLLPQFGFGLLACFPKLFAPCDRMLSPAISCKATRQASSAA